ncbi:solute carrier family 49 member 4 homolog [Saccoglossus kowalevskii]|uniref:Disrupted in renal carcinoma protein 2 homolog n=1 Tax=Saccoglossus kowalevskii TaxID=10224 RepID=A0ABM0M5D1_SACKO|nr:PREDICTED: disrupted in renal carcinoma protein 2 homolog [Saccoglossus kowalevskii]
MEYNEDAGYDVKTASELGYATSADGRGVNHEDNNPLLTDIVPNSFDDQDTAVYKRRWYILITFSLTAFTQSAAWNTWGPIADTAKSVLGWSAADIALLTNWGPIGYIPTALFWAWLMDVKGMRVSSLMASALVAAGLAIRCIPVPMHLMKLTMNVGQCLCGIAGPVLMAGPTSISVTWFPPNERTTATAIASIFAYFGVAASFLIGPMIVKDRTTGTNTTMSPINTTELEKGGWAALLFLIAVVYFPAKPPLPPSRSASIQRVEYKPGILKLVKSIQFWYLGLAYGLTTGVYAGWGTVVDIILRNVGTSGVSQSEAAWIGFWGNIAGSIGGLFIARVVDCIGGHIKIILLISYGLSGITIGWFLFLRYDIIAFHTVSLYVSLISLGFLLTASVPLIYELTVENSYPIAEGITTIVLTWLNNFFCLLFLVILMIPSVGTAWMNWMLLSSVVLAIPLLILFREKYNRMIVDKLPPNQSSTIQS